MKKVIATLLFCLISVFGWGATYYVDASRDSNGDGTEASPWKLWSDINWTTVTTALSSDNVIIYLSARDTWASSGSFTITSTGNVTYSLSLIGDEKYNLVNSGAASWQAEDAGNRAILTNSGGNGGDIRVDPTHSYITVKGFYVDTPTWGGINLGNDNPSTDIHHITIDNCVIDSPANNHGIWLGYAETGCTDIIIKNCTIHDVKLEGIYIGHYNYMGNSITGVIIENNILYDCGTAGEGDIDLKPAAYGAIVRNNVHYRTSTGVAGSNCGVVIASNNVKVYGNKFYMAAQDTGSDWGFGIYLNADGDGTTGQAITACEIYNNLLYTNDRAGIKVSATKATHNLTGIKVYENTIVSNGTYGFQMASSNGCTVTVADFKNNIVANNTGYDMYIANADCSITVANNNLYYRSSGNSWYYQGVEKTWTTWKALGFDANGLNQDPALDGNYKPTSSSPGNDQGATLGSPYNIDLDGISRPQGTDWDMGAYEYIYLEGGQIAKLVATQMILKLIPGFDMIFALLVVSVIVNIILLILIYKAHNEIIMNRRQIRFFEDADNVSALSEINEYLGGEK